MENKMQDHIKMVRKLNTAIMEFHSFHKKNFSCLKTEDIEKMVEEVVKINFEHFRTMEELCKF